MTEERLFELLVNTPAAERAAALDRLCGADAALRSRLEALLAADGTHLREPPTADAPAGTAAYHPDDTRPVPESVGEAGQVVADRYKLVERIGEGGMGTVWMAQQTAPVKRAVAVKLIKPGMDSKAVLARFEAERQALALMDHPHIARVFDGGVTADGRPYFAMELVKGVPITRFCDDRRLTPRQRLELFVSVCQAVQHAHQKGVIHRDLKPSNVLVALYDDKPVPKVIDFGVAKATGAALTDRTLMTGFGAVVGTPEYMSPEQASFNAVDVDTRSDVYALGVILYELLTGSTPVDRKSMQKAALLEILRIVREVDPPRPSAKLSTSEALPSIAAVRGVEPKALTGLLRSELDWVVMKALEKDRQRRYETANGLAADVQRYLAGEAVQAHPPGAGYRLRKFVRRHRGPVLAAAVVLVAVLLGFAGTAAGLVEAQRQQTIAEANERRAGDSATEAAARQKDAEGSAADALKSAELARTREAEARKLASFVATNEGLRLAEAGDLYGGLSWFVRAMDADPDNADLQAASRVRFATYERLATAFHLVQVMRLDGGAAVRDLCFSPDGTRLSGVTWSNDRGEEFRQWRVSDERAVGGPLELGSIRYPMPDIGSYLSADQSRLLTLTSKGGVQVHDLTTGAVRLTVSAEEAKKRQWAGAGVIRFNSEDLVLMPDGKQLLLVAKDAIQLWDVDHDRPATKPVAVKLGFIKGEPVAVPSRDGRRVAVLVFPDDTRQAVRVLDGATLEAVGPDIPLKNGSVDSLAVSGDGRRVAVAENDGRLGVWEAESGNEVWSTTVSPLSKIGFSPHGDVLFAHGASVFGAAAGDRLEFLDLRERRSSLAKQVPGRNSGGGTEGVYRWSPDGRYLAIAAGSNNRSVRVVDSWTGQSVGPALAGSICAFSPDGRQLATAGADGLTRVWEFRPRHREVDVGDRFRANTTTVVFGPSPERVHLLTRSGVGQKQDLVAVDLQTGRPAGAGLTTPTYSLSGDLWLHRLVVDGDDGPQVWDSRTGTNLRLDIPVAHSPLGGLFDLARGRVRVLSFARPATFTPDGRRVGGEDRYLVAETWDGLVHLCDAATGRPTAVAPVRIRRRDGYSQPQAHVILSTDGSRVVTSDGEGTLRAWQVADGREVGRPFACPLPPDRLFFLDDRRVCVIGRKSPGSPGGTDGEQRVVVYDVTTGEPTFPPLVVPTDGSVILIRPTRQIAFQRAAPNPQLTLWDWTTGQQVGEPLQGVGFVFGTGLVTRTLPNGRLLAQRENRELVALDPTTAAVQNLPLPAGTLSAGKLSADGRRLLHGSRLWDTSDWQPLTPPVLSTTVSGMSADPAMHVVTGLENVGSPVVRQWDLRGTDRPVEELRALARLWSGRHFTAEGYLVEDTPAERWQQYQTVQAGYPAALAPVDVRAVREWHARQASDAMRFNHLRLPAAEWHLTVLAGSPPLDADERFRLGRLYADLAYFYASGGLGVARQPDLARARYRVAAEHFREAVRDDPHHTLARAWLASASAARAGLGAAAGRSDDATAAWAEARDTLVKLRGEFPGNSSFLLSLADVCANLGVRLKDAGRLKEAEPELRQAVDLYRGLVALERAATAADPYYAADPQTGKPKNPPPAPEHLDQIAWVASHLGIVCRDTDRPQEAEAAFAESIEIRRALAAPEGVAAVRRSYLAWTLAHAGKAARLRKDLAAARKLLDEADGHLRAILKAEPNNADFRQHDVFWFEEYAYLLIASGEYARLPPLAADRAKAGTSSINRAYGLACVFALCSSEAGKDQALTADRRQTLANEYAVEAVKHLRSAVDQGFRDVKWLRADPDFVSVRMRDDFKTLLADLDKKLATPPEPKK